MARVRHELIDARERSHAALAMTPIEFKSAQVEPAASAGTLVIALFDGNPVPNCVALLACEAEAAEALRQKLGSALEMSDPSDL